MMNSSSLWFRTIWILSTAFLILSLVCQQILGARYAAERTIRENIALNTPVLNMRELLLQGGEYTMKQVSEDILLYPANRRSFLPFALDEEGKIYVKQKLDREELCSPRVTTGNVELAADKLATQEGLSLCQSNTFECCKLLHIQLSEKRTLKTRNYYIKILIEDENDNEPIFSNVFAHLNLMVSEDAPLLSEYLLPRAEDPDSPNNSVNHYTIDRWIIGQAHYFNLTTKRVDNVLIPSLQLVRSLDRETIPLFVFVFKASDNVVYPRYGSVTLSIKISDVNDNHPRFDKTLYTSRVKEHSTRETTILEFEVTDPDEGENGQVTVRIQDPLEKALHLFQIHWNPRRPYSQGTLLVVNDVDYEKEGSEIKFYLMASDHGRPSLTSTATVILFIDNVNDHPPEIRFMLMGQPLEGHVNLKEGTAAVGSVLTELHVFDKDTPLKQLHCRQVSGDVYFRLESPFNGVNSLENYYESGAEKTLMTPYLQFTVRCIEALDRESRELILVTVECNDEDAVSPLKTNASLRVNVVDINDNPPIFVKDIFLANVEENRVHQPVINLGGVILASDLDIGQNALLTYSIVNYNHSTDGDWFQMDPKTAKIHTKLPLDYETKQVYEFMVKAVDGGSGLLEPAVTRLTGTARVQINVIDMNDCPPIMNQSHYTFTVKENVPIGTVVGRVDAIDKDSDDKNRRSFFSIRDGGHLQDLKYILINKYTGELQTKSSLDYEQRQMLTVTVVVQNVNPLQLTDGNGPSGPQTALSSEATVIISIINVNDNPPYFEAVFHDKPSHITFYMEHLSNKNNVCEQMPYTVRDEDMKLQDQASPNPNDKAADCCELTLVDSYDGTFEIMKGADNVLCIMKSPPQPRTYQISLLAIDRGDRLNLTATTHFTVIVKHQPFSQKILPLSTSDDDEFKSNTGFFHGATETRHLTIIIVLACAAGLICIGLFITIILLKRYGKGSESRRQDTSINSNKHPLRHNNNGTQPHENEAWTLLSPPSMMNCQKGGDCYATYVSASSPFSQSSALYDSTFVSTLVRKPNSLETSTISSHVGTTARVNNSQTNNKFNNEYRELIDPATASTLIPSYITCSKTHEDSSVPMVYQNPGSYQTLVSPGDNRSPSVQKRFLQSDSHLEDNNSDSIYQSKVNIKAMSQVPEVECTNSHSSTYASHSKIFSPSNPPSSAILRKKMSTPIGVTKSNETLDVNRRNASPQSKCTPYIQTSFV